jgi:hypothetical protein
MFLVQLTDDDEVQCASIHVSEPGEDSIRKTFNLSEEVSQGFNIVRAGQAANITANTNTTKFDLWYPFRL